MGAIHDTAAYIPATTTTDSNIGWALGAGLRLNLPSWGKGDYAIAQFNYADGATNYLLSNSGAGGAGAFNYQDGYPAVTNVALGPVFDAVGTGTSIQNSKGWMVTGGFEHVWNPQWKTSLYGAYGKLDYSTAASSVIGTGAVGSALNADWSLWQVGSRTVWTPVPNLDLSLEVLYTDLNKSAFQGNACGAAVLFAAGSSLAPGCTFDSKGFVSAIFRAQRNFWP